MDIYVNARASAVRIVQYVTLGATLLFVFIGYSEGVPEIAPFAGLVGAACLAGFEFLYIRTQVTRVGRDDAGWVMHTLSTFGERSMRFDASQARLGNVVQRQSLYGETQTYYPFNVAGRRYILDATPPTVFDAAAFNQHFIS